MPVMGLQARTDKGKRGSDHRCSGVAEEVEMTDEKAKETAYCSFCGRSGDEVEEMVIGPCVLICADCVQMCSDVIKERRSALQSQE